MKVIKDPLWAVLVCNDCHTARPEEFISFSHAVIQIYWDDVISFPLSFVPRAKAGPLMQAVEYVPSGVFDFLVIFLEVGLGTSFVCFLLPDPSPSHHHGDGAYKPIQPGGVCSRHAAINLPSAFRRRLTALLSKLSVSQSVKAHLVQMIDSHTVRFFLH